MPGMIGVSSGEVSRYASFYPDLLKVRTPAGTGLAYAPGALVCESRNCITRRAISEGAEWVWFVDDDHYFPPDTLERLLAHQVDIVSGLYVTRNPPFTAVLRVHDDKENEKYSLTPLDVGLKAVSSVGAGCLLVRSNVLKALDVPCWRFGETSRGSVIGEDIDFCRRAREKGFNVWCDLDAPVGHRMSSTLSPYRDVTSGEWSLRLIDFHGMPVVSWSPAPVGG